MLKRLEETPKGPRLILSRADPLFVQALFELEVPEIQQRIVEIRAAAREVGSRTKIAVSSRDDAIDPVGACGTIAPGVSGWPALAPAKVSALRFNEAEEDVLAIVEEDQLSLAIGKEGQNVRLASKLTGWKIDLYCSREWRERGGEGPLFAPLEPEDELVADVLLNELKGLPGDLVEALEATGMRTLRDILDLEREDVLKTEGITDEQADSLMSFLSEMTEENTEPEADAEAEGRDAGSETTAAA